jgi:hypothetical protein
MNWSLTRSSAMTQRFGSSSKSQNQTRKETKLTFLYWVDHVLSISQLVKGNEQRSMRQNNWPLRIIPSFRLHACLVLRNVGVQNPCWLRIPFFYFGNELFPFELPGRLTVKFASWHIIE